MQVVQCYIEGITMEVVQCHSSTQRACVCVCVFVHEEERAVAITVILTQI